MAVEITIKDKKLFIEIKGLHKLWAFKGSLEIPLEHVKGARADAAAEATKLMGWRLIGTSVPGVIQAGTFSGKEGHVFWDVRDLNKSVVIDLHDEKYAHLVVEVEDPAKAVALIEKAIG